jgi:hypothetical protein
MTKYSFIVYDTCVVSGVIYVYGWLDRGEVTGNAPEPRWYELTAWGQIPKPSDFKPEA